MAKPDYNERYDDVTAWREAAKSFGFTIESWGQTGGLHAHNADGEVVGTWLSRYETSDDQAKGWFNEPKKARKFESRGIGGNMAFKVGDLVTPTVRSNKGVTGAVSRINKDGTYQVSFGKNDAGEMDQVDYKENELELYETMKTSLDHMLKAFVKGDLEAAAAHLRECMKGKMKKRVKKLAEANMPNKPELIGFLETSFNAYPEDHPRYQPMGSRSSDVFKQWFRKSANKANATAIIEKYAKQNYESLDDPYSQDRGADAYSSTRYQAGEEITILFLTDLGYTRAEIEDSRKENVFSNFADDIEVLEPLMRRICKQYGYVGK